MSRGETGITDGPLEGQERDAAAGHGEPRSQGGTENSRPEPEQIESAVQHAESSTEELPDSDRGSLGKTDRSLTDDVLTNENSRLIPQQGSTPNHTPRTEADERGNPAPDLHNDHASLAGHANGAPPICTPPTSCGGRPGWRLHQPAKCGGKKGLPSPASRQESLKTTAAQIQQVAGDDCCVHCVLACLFCELLSLCSAIGQCVACGSACEALCCCGGGASGGVACGEDACEAALDCGIMEDCCGSSDCLEICLECCSICFPA